MMASTKSLGRGGPRNYVKGIIDVQHLSDILVAYVKKVGAGVAFDFADYEGLWHNCGPRGKTLARLHSLILCFLKVQPAATIVYSDLKAAFQIVFCTFPDAKVKSKTIDEAASDTADRLVVIQKHCRLFSVGKNAEYTWNKMKLELTHAEVKLLTQIKESIATTAASAESSSSRAQGS